MDFLYYHVDSVQSTYRPEEAAADYKGQYTQHICAENPYYAKNKNKQQPQQQNKDSRVPKKRAALFFGDT